MKKFPFFLLAVLLPAALAAQNARLDSLWNICESLQFRIPDRCIPIMDLRTPRSFVGRKLYPVPTHPGLDSLLSSEQQQRVLAEINRRCDSLGKDSLTTCELFYVHRPYFDRLHFEDPHYRIYMTCYLDREAFRTEKEGLKMVERLTMPAFSLLEINDTLLVDRSLEPQFHTGDLIERINGVPASEYLKYGYHDHYTYPTTVMHRYYYSHVVDRFRFDILREGRPLTLETAGIPFREAMYRLSKAEELDRNIRTYPEAGAGYIAVPEFFFNNNRLIRVVRKAIVAFKKQGITNVILDLRRNPGGNGHAFDRLLSIFIDKPTVDYCTGQRIKVSRNLLKDYDFLTEEMIGEVMELPESEIVRSFPTDPKMHVAGMNCYVLVGRDTGSIAASFVNMLQYHDAAQLVGEPLRHNALKYGEVDRGRRLLPSFLAETSVSLVQIDECTRRDDSYVMPDIPLPAVAADYATGRDTVLDRLLDMLRRQQ